VVCVILRSVELIAVFLLPEDTYSRILGMKKLQAKILILATFLILLAIITFVVNHVIALSSLLTNISPLLGTISLWILLGLIFLCVFYLVGTYFFRQKPLEVPVDPTPEQEQAYLASVIRRLNSNKILISRCVQVNTKWDISGAISLLDSITNDEIKQVAKRVFVATAISQNGRLDSIIVFYQIVGLIWKISKIHDQRPYPYELWKIYCNVLTTSMISYGIEQVDLTDQIGSIVSPLFANSVLDHVPVVKTFTKVFTHGILSGSANAGLVCRVGIVARNYMGLKARVDNHTQLRPTLEATRMLNSISSESAQKVLTALADSMKGITVRSTIKAKSAVVNAAGAAVQGVADAGRSVGEGTMDAYGTTKEGLKTAGGGAVRRFRTLGCSVRDLAAHGTKKATGTIVNVAGVVKRNAVDAGGVVGSRAHEAFCTTREDAKKIAVSAAGTTQKCLSGIKKSAKKFGSILSKRSR
jgi:hypothetical protein